MQNVRLLSISQQQLSPFTSKNILMTTKQLETSKFDIADYLGSNEIIAEYLSVVSAEGDDSDVITAIGHAAKSL
jgi:hypothetical protein